MSQANPENTARHKFWEFLKDIGPILVGLTAVLGSIWSSNLDRAERGAERAKSEQKEEFNRRLEVARRMVGACLKIDDDSRELEDVARQGLNAEAEQDEGRLSSDIEEFDQAYGESVLLFNNTVVDQLSPISKSISAIDFPRTENSKDLQTDANEFSESIKQYRVKEQDLLEKLRALFIEGHVP